MFEVLFETMQEKLESSMENLAENIEKTIKHGKNATIIGEEKVKAIDKLLTILKPSLIQYKETQRIKKFPTQQSPQEQQEPRVIREQHTETTTNLERQPETRVLIKPKPTANNYYAILVEEDEEYERKSPPQDINKIINPLKLNTNFNTLTIIPYEDKEVQRQNYNQQYPTYQVTTKTPRYITRSKAYLVNNVKLKTITENVSIRTEDMVQKEQIPDFFDENPSKLVKKYIEQTNIESLNAVYDPALQAYLEYRQIIQTEAKHI